MEVGIRMVNRKIISLAIGKPKDYIWNGIREQSGIGKENVEKTIVKKSGIEGNDVANKDYHGGVDRAVCLYPYEHYSNWEAIFKTKLPLPALGENLTVAGMTEEDVCIGDIYKIGDTVIQITQGRIPCSTISKFNQKDQFLNKVFDTGLTGYFSRVLEEGMIYLSSKIELVEKHPKGISVLFATQTLLHHHDRNAIEKILAVEELADDWRKRFLKLL